MVFQHILCNFKKCLYCSSAPVTKGIKHLLMLPKVKMLQILKTATNEILGEILSIKGVVI